MTSFLIKIVAIIAMTIDHCAAIVGQMGLISIFPNLSLSVSYHIINIMRGIGRIAFPIFAFLISEGAQKTRSMPKYIARLFLFAIISEPIYYFALSLETPTLSGFFDNIVGLNLGNVFFTLALAAIAIYAYQLLSNRKSKYLMLQFAPICLIIMFVGGYIGCDYGMAGILLIVLLYLAKTKPQKYAVIVIWSIFSYLIDQISLYNIIKCIFAAASCLLIWLYNGERGKQMKWSFYVYYPAHLLLLTIAESVIK